MKTGFTTTGEPQVNPGRATDDPGFIFGLFLRGNEHAMQQLSKPILSRVRDKYLKSRVHRSGKNGILDVSESRSAPALSLCKIMFRLLSMVPWLLMLMMAAVAAQVEDATTYRLPENPKAIVFSYDEQNGFMPPRRDSSPLFSIQSDGTVRMPDVFGSARDVTGKISQRELQELLRFAIEENKFFDYDPAKVKAAMQKVEKERQIPQIVDVPESVFEIRTADENHKVRHFAIGMAGEYKEIEEVQRLSTLHRRVMKLMGEIRVGGKVGIRKLLKLANEELKHQYPDVKSLTVENFQGSYRGSDGKISATFSRRGKTAQGKPDGSFLVAVLEIPENGDPTVTIRFNPKA